MKTTATLILMLFARAVFSLQQWLIIVIVARSGTLEELGALGLSLAIVTPLCGLFGLGLRQGVATDIAAQHSPKAYWFLRLGGFLPIAVTACFAGQLIFPQETTPTLILSVVFMKVVDLNSELGYGFLQRQNRLSRIGTSQIIRAISGTIAFWLAWKIGASLSQAILAWSLVWLVLFLVFDLPASWQNTIAPQQKITVNSLIRLVYKQIPFGIAAGITMAGLTAPRLIYGTSANLQDLGVFSALVFIFQAGHGFIVALLQTRLSPMAAAIHANDNTTLRRLFLPILIGISGLSTIMTLIAFTFENQIPALLYGTGFRAPAGLLSVLSLGWALRYISTVIRSLYHARRQFWQGMGADVLLTFLTVFGCFVGTALSPDALGISLGFTISQTVGAIWLLLQTPRLLR